MLFPVYLDFYLFCRQGRLSNTNSNLVIDLVLTNMMVAPLANQDVWETK